MQKKVPQKRNILIVIASILFGLMFVSGVLAATIGEFKHYEDKAEKWTADQINAGQSGYTESEVLPHFAQFNDLTLGTTYYFYIFMDFYSQSTNACGFDELAQWDTTTRLVPISTTGIAPSGTPPVEDKSFADAGVGTGNLYSYGTNINSTIITMGADSGTGGNVQTNILIQFEASATTADFYWGQHIAIPGACDGRLDSEGNTIVNSNGASDWPGGGLRTKIQDEDGAGIIPTGVTQLPESGAISIMPSAIRPPTFEGYKWFDTNGNGIWDIQGTETPCDNPPNIVCEPTLPYWRIYLEKCTSASPADCTLGEVDDYVTDTDGYYAVFVPLDSNYDIEVGYYRVCEDIDGQNPKWENTYPHPYATTNPVCHPIEYIDNTSDNFSDVNFGNWWGTTAVDLSDFRATPENKAILVEWQTVEQTETDGFNLYRSRDEDGRRKLVAYEDVNFDCVGVCDYEYLDENVKPGKTYYYWLEALYAGGSTEEFGPVNATVPKKSNPRGKR